MSRAESHTWHMLVSELDVDDVTARLRGAVRHFTCAVLYILTVNVHFARPLNGQAQTTITY